MKKSYLIILIVLLALTIIFSVSLFSVTSTFTEAENHFRQEVGCGRTTSFQFDNIIVDYTTKSVSSRTLDPESDWKTDCVPTYIKIRDNQEIIFEYSQVNGVIIDKMTPSAKYDVALDDYSTLDNGQVYVPPNNYIESADFTLYTLGDTVGSSPLYSEKIPIGEEFNRGNGFYSFDIDNNGHSSTGYTEGSELYYHIYFRKANMTLNVLSDSESIIADDEINFEIVSQYPVDVKYGDVCIDLGVQGFFDVQYETLCTGQTGNIASGETKQFTVGIPNDTRVVEYKIRPNINNIYLLTDGVTTTYVRDYDVSRYLISGNMLNAGNFVGEWQNVSLLEAYEQELSSLEGSLQDKLDYINSLEASDDEKKVYIQSLELTEQEYLDYIEELEVSQQEKDDLITLLEEQTTNKEQVILDLQEDLSSGKNILYVAYGITFLAVLIFLIRLMIRRGKKK